MLTNWKQRRSFESEAFDMTPIIDVVFLLIIFFMLVCQFIAADQFHVQVPDAIQSAQSTDQPKPSALTITVMQDATGQAVYAVGGETLEGVGGSDLAGLIRSEIDRLLSQVADADKTVRLRCDQAVTFGEIKHLLAGISQSQAAHLDWAVLGD